MYTACIIDDEVNSREVLELMILENHQDISILGSAANCKDGIQMIRELHPDIVFLDIEMPGGSGFDLVRQLSEPIPQLIFCTAYGHYAIKAIECSALAYLLKPVSSQKLHDAIEKAKMKSNPLQRSLQRSVLQEQLHPGKEPTRFLINTVEDTKVILFDDVMCCVAESNYTKLYLGDGSKLLVSKTLKEFETILYKPNFFRIHHSYLINVNYVRRIIKTDGCMVELLHNIVLDVSRSKREELLTRVTSL
jgi:two-component system LytT family response regulator